MGGGGGRWVWGWGGGCNQLKLWGLGSTPRAAAEDDRGKVSFYATSLYIFERLTRGKFHHFLSQALSFLHGLDMERKTEVGCVGG